MVEGIVAILELRFHDSYVLGANAPLAHHYLYPLAPMQGDSEERDLNAEELEIAMDD